MNPEFIRNVWLELTPRRMTIMAVLLILAFLAGEGSSGLLSSGSIAQNLYYLIVVLWGTRNAALSVVGEIRDRTWDLQRLSSIGPGAMTVGKLFGGTIYNWFGGAICLIMILVQSACADGIARRLLECVRLIGMGALAQAASLLASLDRHSPPPIGAFAAGYFRVSDRRACGGRRFPARLGRSDGSAA